MYKNLAAMVPFAVGVRSAMEHPTRRCVPGGYKIRPYRPAPGFPVGAACMAARDRLSISAGVRWFRLVGADAHIGPSAPGPGSPPTAAGVGRHAHMPPGPGALSASSAKVVPGYGRAMRAPTVCAFDDGASDAAARADIKCIV